MIGEEVRQHRGIKQISFAAIALLLSLTVVALYQRSQAEAQRTIGRPAPPNPAMNSRRRIFDPSRWISEPYHNYGCRERWFALVPMFAALRKSASGPEHQFAAPQRHSRCLGSCGHANGVVDPTQSDPQWTLDPGCVKTLWPG